MLALADLKASNGFVSRALLIVGAALCAWTLQTSAARADTTIGADLDLGVPIEINDVGTGAGFAFRIGQELHLPLISINPEFVFSYTSFSKGEPPTIYRGLAGARLGIGELIRFGVLAHIGFGYINWEPAPDDWSHTGLTYDAGIFLDFTALPLLNLGVHGTYNRIAAHEDQRSEILHWLNFGVHATVVL